MVDSTIEISENLPVPCYVIELAEKLPVVNTIEINTGLGGARKSYNVARLIRNLYTDVGVQININRKTSHSFDRKSAKKFLKLNIGNGNGYEIYPTKTLFGNTYLTDYDQGDALKLRITNSIDPYAINRAVEKEFYKANQNLAGPAKSERLSSVIVEFRPEGYKKRLVRGFKKGYVLFERCNPFRSNEIPVSYELHTILSNSAFSLIKKKSECYFRAYIDSMCFDICTCDRSLEDCFTEQNEHTKELYEKGKLNIMKIVNCNLEKTDVKKVAHDNGFKEAYRKIYLKTLLTRLKAGLKGALDRSKVGNSAYMDSLIYQYNQTAKEQGWKKTNSAQLSTMIDRI